MRKEHGRKLTGGFMLKVGRITSVQMPLTKMTRILHQKGRKMCFECPERKIRKALVNTSNFCHKLLLWPPHSHTGPTDHIFTLPQGEIHKYYSALALSNWKVPNHLSLSIYSTHFSWSFSIIHPMILIFSSICLFFSLSSFPWPLPSLITSHQKHCNNFLTSNLTVLSNIHFT